MNLKRVSPLLERETETELLNLAPEPWKILKCLETDIVFLENPPGYEALKEKFAWEKTYQSEVESKQNAEPLRYKVSSFAVSYTHLTLPTKRIV